ncbi:unnamed protein product [Zymoseptoria tritici ST99CH_3D7]|uniref:Myb-like domain-containing protein n=1 Tax=Zymoseptoria tritici (strain ST99CH_3D7) TaxID=1276538 RepID=A0A1X7RYP7_ZYMT9|nr:unnamed protein product [Zymoseptoria tritici ST99CH_3D7]
MHGDLGTSKMWPRVWSATFTIRSRAISNTAYSTFEQVRSFHNTSRFAARAGPWTPEEDSKLLRLKESGRPWADIVSEMPLRTFQALESRYHIISPRGPGGTRVHGSPRSRAPRGGQRRTPQEDDLLLKLRERGQDWLTVQLSFPHRSRQALVLRYFKIGPRTPAGRLAHQRRLTAEDRNLICQLRTEKVPWKEIGASYFPRFSLSTLQAAHWGESPGLTRKGPWTAAEQELLLGLRAQRPHWKAISARLQRSVQGSREKHRALVQGTRGPALQRHDAFLPEDNAAITTLQRQDYSRRDIVKNFPSRTRVSIQFRLFLARRWLGLTKAQRPSRSLLNSQEIMEIVSLRKSGSDWVALQARFPHLSIAQLKSIYNVERTYRSFAASVEAVEARNSASSSGE